MFDSELRIFGFAPRSFTGSLGYGPFEQALIGGGGLPCKVDKDTVVGAVQIVCPSATI
jgi:hypothetical protein